MNNVGTILLGVFAMTMAAEIPAQETDYGEFTPVSVERTGSFELDMTPDQALPLFTAPGERLWVPRWDPIVLSGDGFEQGTTFVTTNHGGTSYWLVGKYDVNTRRAQYVRVTPEVDIATVDVALTANESGGSIVSVTYHLTGLSAAGNDRLKTAYSEDGYAHMLAEWRSLLDKNRDKIDAHFNQ